MKANHLTPEQLLRTYDANAARGDTAAAYRAKSLRASQAALRSMPYAEYLTTRHWQQTRYRALQRAGYRCEECRATNTVTLDVHHLTYERRGCERDTDLRVLCRACHDKTHGVAE